MMTRYCISCGAALAEGARFCGACGASVVAVPDMQRPVERASPMNMPAAQAGETIETSSEDMGAALQNSSGTSYAEPAVETTAWDVTPIEEVSPQGPNWLLIGGGIGIFLFLLLYYLIFIRDDVGGNPALPAPKVSATEKIEEVETKQFFIVADANIRDRPTALGSTILGKMVRGAAVNGVVVNGEDETSEWLQLEDEKGFIGLVNLSDSKPPAIAKALGDKNWTSEKPLEIWSLPDTSATLIDRVPAGTVLTLFGLTGNDYIEVKLRRGGVGYLAGGAKLLETAAPLGKPITLSFNPSSCNFGGELDSELERLAKKVSDTYTRAEKAEYPSEAAREKALQALEGKSAYAKLQRSFNGLTITGVGLHREAQSVYFAEPAEQVIAAFRSAGYKIGKDGNFPSSELYASIGPSAETGRAYGKAELGCGV